MNIHIPGSNMSNFILKTARNYRNDFLDILKISENQIDVLLHASKKPNPPNRDRDRRLEIEMEMQIEIGDRR